MQKFILASAIGMGFFAGSALAQNTGSAQNAGKVTNITGETGEVIVQRGTAIYSLGPDDEIFPGDKVTTQAGGTVRISAFDCTVELDPKQSIVINAEFCDTPPVTLNGGGARTALLIGGGVVGVAAIASLAGDDDDDDGSPASP